jgi:hypothetical protein
LLPAFDRRVPRLAIARRAKSRSSKGAAGSPGRSNHHHRTLEAPEASPKSREEKRFNRADKDKNGKIESEELLDARRKAFGKLDTNGNGTLNFEEWAVTTIDKFKGADRDRSGWLTPAEYATTAPPPPKPKPKCAC